MDSWPKVTLIFVACLGLSAALASPGSHHMKGAFVECGMSLGCTDSLFHTLVLSFLAVLSPFAIFLVGAILVTKVLRGAGWHGRRRFIAAAGFALLSPIILLLYIFS